MKKFEINPAPAHPRGWCTL